MGQNDQSKGGTKIRPSWGGNCGKRSDPPPTPRSEERQTSRPTLDLPPVGDTRRVDLQLRGAELALTEALATIDRLREALRVSRQDAERLRMTLAQVRDALSDEDSTT